MEPISAASSVLTLVVFAFQSSQALYQVVDSFRNNQRTVRELKEELGALGGVLQSLEQTATSPNINFASLKLPLLRCGKACSDFEAVIVKCTLHSGGSRTSFRDWAKLTYLGKNIDGFKNMIGSYKSTISIALGDANLRTAAATANVLEEYKEMIANTTTDLEDHLKDLDDKMKTLSLQGISISDEDAVERQQIQEEKDSTQQCLGICAKVFTHIDQIQASTFEDISTPAGNYERFSPRPAELPFARAVTSDAFKTCKSTLSDVTTQLKTHLQDIDSRLQQFAMPSSDKPIEQNSELEKLKEELLSVKQCLAICDQASSQANQERTNFFEDVSMADDGHQVLVSTIGDLVSAKRVTAGARSAQWIGQMSDDSLQLLSQNRDHITFGNVIGSGKGINPQFEDRHGTGFKLSMAK